MMVYYFHQFLKSIYIVEINRERDILLLFYSNSFPNIVTQLSWDSRGSPKRIEVFRKVENLVRYGKVYHNGKNRKLHAPHNFQLHESSEILLSELCRVKCVFSSSGFRSGFAITAIISNSNFLGG